MENILIVIVLYKIKLYDSIAYNSLNISPKQFFLIYDNSPKSLHYSIKERNIFYIHNPNNPGLSFAYNKALDFAKANGFKWMLLADQDTWFPNSITYSYVENIERNPEIKLFVPKVKVSQYGLYLSPVLKNHYFPRLSQIVPDGVIIPDKYAIINSGILVNVEAYEDVGGYNEKVFLDFSDFQFIERFANKYRDAFVIDAECLQSFSDEIPDVQQKIIRFKLFCSSVKHYQPLRSINKLWIGCSVLKRTLSLTYQSRSFKPVLIFIKNYLG